MFWQASIRSHRRAYSFLQLNKQSVRRYIHTKLSHASVLIKSREIQHVFSTILFGTQLPVQQLNKLHYHQKSFGEWKHGEAALHLWNILKQVQYHCIFINTRAAGEPVKFAALTKSYTKEDPSSLNQFKRTDIYNLP